MSWRLAQLNKELCNQDSIILDLFAFKDVNYIGSDNEFKKMLNYNSASKNLILIVDRSVWCSDIIKMLHQHLKHPIETFYIGLNRYCIKGNDTVQNFPNMGSHGDTIISMISDIVCALGYSVTNFGCYDNDLGKHFNFVQPLTWAYGYKTNTNK
jgi:hypothetical protein